jgi:hypothetical protein
LLRWRWEGLELMVSIRPLTTTVESKYNVYLIWSLYRVFQISAEQMGFWYISRLGAEKSRLFKFYFIA